MNEDEIKTFTYKVKYYRNVKDITHIEEGEIEAITIKEAGTEILKKHSNVLKMWIDGLEFLV